MAHAYLILISLLIFLCRFRTSCVIVSILSLLNKKKLYILFRTKLMEKDNNIFKFELFN
jgi:hypothetical protein